MCVGAYPPGMENSPCLTCIARSLRWRRRGPPTVVVAGLGDAMFLVMRCPVGTSLHRRRLYDRPRWLKVSSASLSGAASMGRLATCYRAKIATWFIQTVEYSQVHRSHYDTCQAISKCGVLRGTAQRKPRARSSVPCHRVVNAVMSTNWARPRIRQLSTDAPRLRSRRPRQLQKA